MDAFRISQHQKKDNAWIMASKGSIFDYLQEFYSAYHF